MANEFDPASASPNEILRKAKELVGMRLGEIARKHKYSRLENVRDKGAVGKLIQLHFGLAAEDRREAADFEGAGIELKVVPVWVRRGPEYEVKEPTSISKINYMGLPSEKWQTASVRKKLDRILLVFYEHSLKKPRDNWKVLGVQDWRPSLPHLPVITDDWETIRTEVAKGRAHLLSETLTTFLSARTKGSKTDKWRQQPHSTERAKTRAWALKTALTTGLASELLLATEEIGHLRAQPERAELGAVIKATIQSVAQFRGKSLGEVASELGTRLGRGKSAHVSLIRRALGANEGEMAIRELFDFGVRVIVIRCDADAWPYQHTSLPPFDWMDFIDDGWEDSDLSNQLQNIVFVPLLDIKDKMPYDDVVVGPAFHWTPNAEQLRTIATEYATYRREINRGLAYPGLTKASQTKIIHVRQHTDKAANTSDAPDGHGGIKRATISSFWLNREFLQSLLLRSVKWPPKRHG